MRKKIMKNLLAIAVAAGALAVAAPASAQAWQSINQRQANLDQRIDMGVRNGSLTRAEAVRLRGQFNDLSRLEARYRVNGLTVGERADLDRRFNALSSQIRYQRNDDQNRGGNWVSINDRQRDFEARINAGLRDRSLSPVEASRLRLEFQNIAHLEVSYRRNGLNASERANLDQRLDRLGARIYSERHDRNNWYG
jgi:hypothetical protein